MPCCGNCLKYCEERVENKIKYEVFKCDGECGACEDMYKGLWWGCGESKDPPEFYEMTKSTSCNIEGCKRCVKDCLRCGIVLCKHH